MKILIFLVILAVLGLGGYVIFQKYYHKQDKNTTNQVVNVNIVDKTKQKTKVSKKLHIKEEETKISPKKQEIEKDENKKQENEKKKNLEQNIILVLDASGSMWGKIENKPKIQIAKDAVKKILNNSGENLNFGLEIYGDKKGVDKNCENIEVLIEPQKNKNKEIIQKLDNIDPKGKTPIGNAILKAARVLDYKNQKATIVLISDGIDTCSSDLCQVGKDLEKDGVDFTAHIIGFDMTKEQEKGIECLAHETGGLFLSAKNTDELNKALAKSIKKIDPCSKEALENIEFSASDKLENNKKFKVSWQGDVNDGDKVFITKNDSKEVKDALGEVLHLKKGQKEGELFAPNTPGKYSLVYSSICGVTLNEKTFEVYVPSNKVEIAPVVEPGINIEVSWSGANDYGDDVAIVPKGASLWKEGWGIVSFLEEKNGISKIETPRKAGEYDLIYLSTDEKVLARKTFRVREIKGKLLGVPDIVKKNEAFNVRWEGEENDGNIITILPKDSVNWQKHTPNGLYNIEKTQKNIKLVAPDSAGVYDVVFWYKKERELYRKTIRVTQ